MKSFLIFCSLLLSPIAFSKTIQVKGMQAKTLLDIGNELNSTDGAMGGRLFMKLENVHCEKTVDDQAVIYLQTCSFDAFERVVVRSDSEEHHFTAELLRSALNDIVKNEVKVSPVKKTIDVKMIECKGIGLGHALDGIDIEPKYSCSLKF